MSERPQQPEEESEITRSSRIIRAAYRRIGVAFQKGRGVRFSAHEVACIWTIDSAVVNASMDEEDLP